jgi:hypothetical protein
VIDVSLNERNTFLTVNNANKKEIFFPMDKVQQSGDKTFFQVKYTNKKGRQHFILVNNVGEK